MEDQVEHNTSTLPSEQTQVGNEPTKENENENEEEEVEEIEREGEEEEEEEDGKFK
jgi:hypothetical protein